MRLTGLMLRLAARRWPADIAADMLREWEAEASVLRPAASLRYALSLLISPAVDEPSWHSRATTAAAAGGVTLLAAALSNAVHATTPLMILLAGAVMVAAGRRARMSPAAAVLLLGPALFTFLFIGNAVAVMPFMGVLDVAPASAAWTVCMLAVTRRPRRGGSLLLGAWASVTAATAAGSLHAAHVLNVSLWSAPTWFPLSLLPAGTVHFGPAAVLPSGLRTAQASEILLGNAAAMSAPMLLSALFVVALHWHRGARLRPHPASSPPLPPAHLARAHIPVAGLGGTPKSRLRARMAHLAGARESRLRARADRLIGTPGTPVAGLGRRLRARTADLIGPPGILIAGLGSRLRARTANLIAPPRNFIAGLGTRLRARTADLIAPPRTFIAGLGTRLRARTAGLVGAPGSDRRQGVAGCGAALAGIAVCELTMLAGADSGAVMDRLLDHSAVFGFGFAVHPAGQAVVALLAAALTLRLTQPSPE